ncbi:Isoflavone reductase P3 [Wickerhamomyces ciferrii]|uniref:Isoflavone reductase P3 n=1 Tax=Wickerhamomyces ciferrii (strain ATCC 14091 / BCRC 22168 / CBS 111 / JCM 3599 / NBRC 0793 / NRRL Y-1031 F-60-10) TaxID=1206466 RepID=K0KP83_WICCF|nr:Isoflavone reductase P3 [Wickerhamomyces ciferrii]CCH44002.1 Isoflavone reductase P3 [Wickerhamomyces ciferrii]
MSTVAVLGLNGFLGKPVIEALLSEPFISQIKQPIRLLTFSDKKQFQSEKVEYLNVSKGFDDALKGVDSVVNLTGYPNKSSEPFLDSVIKNNVKLYIPPQFGIDLGAASSKIFPELLKGKAEHSQRARDNGIKSVDLFTGFFFLEVNNPFVTPLVKINGSEATIIGDESIKVNPTYINDVGKSVASILTAKRFEKLPDKVRIYSDVVDIGQLISRYENLNDLKLSKTYEPNDEYLNNIRSQYQKDGYIGSKFFDYMGAMLVGGEGYGLIFETQNERDVINPNEKYFKWTKFDDKK